MPWKKKTDGAFEVDGSGNPIWVNDADATKEMAINGADVSRLNGEAMANRIAKEKAEKDLKAFEGLDAAAAKDAIDKLAKIDQSKLVDAGKIDEVRAEIGKKYQDELDKLKGELDTTKTDLNKTKIGNAFANSPAIKDKFILGTDMLEKLFGDRFEIKDGQIVGKGADGNPIVSTKNLGKIADFDEAFEQVISTYPNKNEIMKGANQGGTGNTGGGGGNGALRTLTRAQEAVLPPIERAAFAKEVRGGKANLID